MDNPARLPAKNKTLKITQGHAEVIATPEQVDKLVTHSFPMSRAAEAFELLNNRNATEEFVGKVHLIPGE